MTNIRDTAKLVACQVETCFGTLKVQWIGDMICGLGWAARTTSTDDFPLLPEFMATASEAQCRLVDNLVSYTQGEYVSFRDTPVAIHGGTDFQRRIWRTCQQIPYGNTVTYGQLARIAGRPGAARAVGGAMSKNQIPLIIPCHRVVAAGNKLGGFSSPQGTALKKRLLHMEGLPGNWAQNGAS